MNSPSALDLLLKRGRPYVRDWLVSGITKFYVEGDPDGFYPHSFVSADGDPFFTVVHNYQLLDARKQTVLRSAIEGASTMVLPHAWHGILRSNESKAKRLELLSIISAFASHTACEGAVAKLTEAVTGQLHLWDPSERAEAFATVLRCTTDLAISAIDHVSFDQDGRAALERHLTRLVHSDQFRPEYAPRCVHAFVALDADSYFRIHRRYIGNQITLLHKLDREQRLHAHATAEIIAERSPYQLMKYSPEMKITGSEPFDAWMLNAFNSPASRFMLYRKGRNPNEIYLTRRLSEDGHATNPVPVVLKNDDLHAFEVKGDISILTDEKYANHFAGALQSYQAMIRVEG